MKREDKRSGPRLAGSLLLAGLSVALIALVVIALLAWQQTRASLERQAAELSRLRAQVDEIAVDPYRAQLHATAAAQDARLAALERAMQLAEEAAAEPTDVPATDLSAADPPAAWEELATAHAALAARIDELERQVAAHASDPDGMPGTAAAQPLPAMVRLSVDPQKQGHNLSCESSAASMAARYHGVDLGEEDILAALPRDDNPHLGFRGSVDGAPGGTIDYGVYAPPVAAVLLTHGLDAQTVVGGWTGIQTALARGNPIVAWVTYECMTSTPVTVMIGEQPVVLVPYQHAVVVTGYDAGGVWANDPWDGGEDYYARADFERALDYFGGMAIEVAPVGD